MQREETYIPQNWEPEAGVQYTPPEKREAIVIYRSVMRTVQMADTREAGNEILRDLAEVGFGYMRLEDVPNPNRMIISPMLVNVDASSRRHDEAVANGRRGGRPKKEVDTAVVKQLYAELGSYELVAEQMGISRSSIYRALKHESEAESKSQNLTYTSTNTNTKTNTFTKTGTNPLRAPDPDAARRAREAEFERKRRIGLEMLEAHGRAQNEPSL